MSEKTANGFNRQRTKRRATIDAASLIPIMDLACGKVIKTNTRGAAEYHEKVKCVAKDEGWNYEEDGERWVKLG